MSTDEPVDPGSLRPALGPLHPGAWWVWGLSVAAAATTSTNVLVQALLVGSVLVVVTSCAEPTRQRSTLRVYLWVAGWTVVVRLAFRVVFPASEGPGVLGLPELSLGPVVLFGPVSAEALLSGLAGGLQLAVVVLAVGAAHTLADALGLLRHAPSALAGVTTALVVAVAALPTLGRSVTDVRRAARLRGHRPGLRRTVVPVLEGAMERSLTLAAAMEARGYGAAHPSAGTAGTVDERAAGADHGPASPRPGLLQPGALLGAVAAVGLAAYALFDTSWPGWSAPVLAAVAAALCVVALRTASVLRRTVHRAERWTARATVVAASGAGCLALLAGAVSDHVANPVPSLLPDLSVVALVAALLAGVPAVLAARPTGPARPVRRAQPVRPALPEERTP